VRACVWSRNLNYEAAETRLGLLGHRRRKTKKVFVCHGRQITKWRSYIWNSRISIQGLSTTIRFVPTKIAFVYSTCFIVSTSVFHFPHASYSTAVLNSYLFCQFILIQYPFPCSEISVRVMQTTTITNQSPLFCLYIYAKIENVKIQKTLRYDHNYIYKKVVVRIF